MMLLMLGHQRHGRFSASFRLGARKAPSEDDEEESFDLLRRRLRPRRRGGLLLLSTSSSELPLSSPSSPSSGDLPRRGLEEVLVDLFRVDAPASISFACPKTCGLPQNAVLSPPPLEATVTARRDASTPWAGSGVKFDVKFLCSVLFKAIMMGTWCLAGGGRGEVALGVDRVTFSSSFAAAAVDEEDG